MNKDCYSGKILRIDLSSGKGLELPTSDYAPRFLGGRGIAAALCWEEAAPKLDAFDPANPLIFATGPLAGIPVIGGSRWIVYGKSPATDPPHFCSSNLGGDWGLKLKGCGYDALMITGRADKPVYLLLSNSGWELREAAELWGKGAIETREELKRRLGKAAGVAAIGPAGENLAAMATIMADGDASGSGGLGASMGSKNLKAVAVAARPVRTRAAQPERLKDLISHFRSFEKEPVTKASGMPLRITGRGTRKAPCHGCAGTCLRRTYRAEDGTTGKFMCQSATFYQPMAEAYYGPGYEIPFQATRLCDDYGVDTMAITVIIAWLWKCSRADILSEQSTGMPISRLGSLEFIETLIRKISLREGFGGLLAGGIERAAASMGRQSMELLTSQMSKAGQPNVYDARLYINSALLHATEPKPPIPQLQEVTRIIFKWLEWYRGEAGSYLSNAVARDIASRFWGGEAAADFTSSQGKAKAAKLIQDRQYAKECLILCSFLWPVMDSAKTDDNVGDPALEAGLLSAVTGGLISEEELNLTGERIFNLQRAIYLRDGHQGAADDRLPESWYTVPTRWDMANPEMMVPGKGDRMVSRKGEVVDGEVFENMKTEYYRLRKWEESTGLPTRSVMEDLDLADVARWVETISRQR
ncbi:MAG: aldehyde ferredoxin oxidoreductase N-terminal domain-containing protein [Dehalococcoidia bacterium]